MNISDFSLQELKTGHFFMINDKEIYVTSEKTPAGLIVPSTAISALSVDQPVPDSKTGWTVRMGDGWPVYHFPDTKLTDAQLRDERDWLRDENEDPIYHKPVLLREMREKLKVIVKDNPFDYMWGYAGIVKDKDDEYCAVNEYNICPIRYSEIEGCWVTNCVINRKAIKICQK